MNRKEAVYEKDTDTQSDFYSFFICDWLHYADSVTMDDLNRKTKYFSFLSNGFRNTVSDLPTIKKCGDLPIILECTT